MDKAIRRGSFSVTNGGKRHLRPEPRIQTFNSHFDPRVAV
jgi:hypothetical protein